MVDTCLVTGTIVAPDGTPLRRTFVLFQRTPEIPFVADDASAFPAPVTVRTEADGSVAVDLIPGSYLVKPWYSDYEPFRIAVPDQPSVRLEDIQFADPLPPLNDAEQAVLDAREARNEAVAAKGDAESAAQEATDTVADTAKKSQNLSDLTNLKEARANLGTFSTVADVQSRNIPPVLDSIRTNGYYVPGDGGGALYKRVASEPGHAGKIQSADGQWWELAGSEIDVRAFGAKGDGATDDTAALQVALNAAEGKTLIISEGVYIYSDQLTYPPNCVIEARGKAVLKVAPDFPNTGPTLINSERNSTPDDRVHGGTTFRGLMLDGNRDNRVDAGTLTNTLIAFVKTTGCRFENCVVANHEYIGVSDQGSAGMVVAGNEFRNCGRPSSVSPAIWAQDFGGDGTPTTGITVRDNWFHDNFRSAVLFSPAGGGQLRGNVFERNSESTIFVAGVSASGNYPRNIQIVDNHIHTSTITDVAAQGIEVQACRGLLIRNNIIEETDRQAISLHNVEDAQIEGNLLKNSCKDASVAAHQKAAIVLVTSSNFVGFDTCRNIRVAGNRFLDTQATKTQDYCIATNQAGTPTQFIDIDIAENDFTDGYAIAPFNWFGAGPDRTVTIAGNRGHSSQAPVRIHQQAPEETGSIFYEVGFKPRLITIEAVELSLSHLRKSDGMATYSPEAPGYKQSVLITTFDSSGTGRGAAATNALVKVVTANDTVRAEARLTGVDKDGFTLNWVTTVSRPVLVMTVYP